MIGLIILVVAAAYLGLSVMVTRIAMNKAKEKGKPGWHYGLPVGLACYLLVFWDHIPTLLVHQYQCATQSGLVVHKTPKQWKKENPGVAETLKPFEKTQHRYEGNKSIYQLNPRFAWVTSSEEVLLGVRAKHQRVIDTDSGEILMEEFDAHTNIQNFIQGNARLRDYKFWLSAKSCFKKSERVDWLFDDMSFSGLQRKFKHIQD